MWALVEDGNVIEVYNRPKSIVLNNVRYPSNMFTLYTKAEKKQIGIYEVQLKGEPDTKFHTRGQSSFSYDSDKEIVNEDFIVRDRALEDEETTDKDDHDNFIIREGLKTIYQNRCKSQAHSFIQEYQWLVERSIYDNTKTIPSDLSTYVGDIRSSCETICTAIGNCSDLDALKVLFEDTRNEAGEVTKIAIMNDWPDDYDMEKYRR
tara:strand:+ start:429 stop:1046 length:618 start_codon:yes stop_codon:yes gene_type:complete